MSRRTLIKIRERKTFVIGLTIMIIFSLIAIFSDYVIVYDPWDISFERMQPPSFQHLLGTDHIGRDVYSRIIYGSRVSMLIMATAAPLSLLVGTIIGAIAGYYGGVIDSIVARFIDFWLTVPRLILMIMVLAMFGRNVFYMILVISMTIWPPNARLMRAQVLSLKDRPFVQAAVAAGGSRLYILLKHIIPNGFAPVLANASLQMASALMLEASLSFVGLGDPENISWGYVLYEGKNYLEYAWWVSTFAGIPIFIVSCVFIFLNDELTEILQPRMR